MIPFAETQPVQGASIVMAGAARCYAAHMNDEISLTGGAVNQVTRKGNVVYRSGGPWVPTIHTLLRHLHEVGFDLAPQPLGETDDGREMISFLPGEPMPREDWRAEMFTDTALVEAGTMLRRLHEATVGLTFPPGTMWRSGPAGKQVGQVVRHGDLGPWNALWAGDRITGLIDWDFAQPGDPLTDLAQMALYFVPLRGEDHAAACGFTSTSDLPRRLDVICSAYGEFTPAAIVREIERLQLASIQEIEERAAEGRYPWTMFRDNGEIERTALEVAWLRHSFPAAFRGLPGARNTGSSVIGSPQMPDGQVAQGVHPHAR